MVYFTQFLFHYASLPIRLKDKICEQTSYSQLGRGTPAPHSPYAKSDLNISALFYS